MSDTSHMTAELRDRAGKGAARATRRDGRVPAVIYGDKQDPALVSVHPVDLMQRLRTETFFSKIMELKVGNDSHKVLPRDVQFHPVSDKPLHVDFMRVGKDTVLTIMVPVHYENEGASPGIKRGGVLNVIRHEVEVKCTQETIPEALAIDLTGLDIGDSIRISDAKLPEGVRPTILDRDFMLASVAAPTVVKEAAAEEQADGEEGEEAAEEGGEE